MNRFHKVTSFTYYASGKNQYIYFTFPFSYSKCQLRTYQITIRDMCENKDIIIDNVQIFSPPPVVQKITKSIENEIGCISIEDIINQTRDPSKFTRGMIQIKDITNETNVQLGKYKIASYIATKIKFDQTQIINNNVTIVNNAMYLPSK